MFDPLSVKRMINNKICNAAYRDLFICDAHIGLKKGLLQLTVHNVLCYCYVLIIPLFYKSLLLALAVCCLFSKAFTSKPAFALHAFQLSVCLEQLQRTFVSGSPHNDYFLYATHNCLLAYKFQSLPYL